MQFAPLPSHLAQILFYHPFFQQANYFSYFFVEVQQKLNYQLMEILGKISLFIHIVAGISTLIAGPIALFYNKQNQKHKTAGKIFFYAMSIIVVTSLVGFLKYPNLVFYQFLLGIALLVGYNLTKGIRTIGFMKGKNPESWDIRTAEGAILTGTLMLGAAGWYLTQNTNIALPILFSVFGLAIISDGIRYRKILLRKEVDSRLWFKLHISAMFGAFIASTTAFTVNTADFLPWYLQWFGPTLLLTPIQILLLKQRKLMSKDLKYAAS